MTRGASNRFLSPIEQKPAYRTYGPTKVVFGTKASSTKFVRNSVPQTLSETQFDFVTFLAKGKEADIGAECSISYNGLNPAIRRTAAFAKTQIFASPAYRTVLAK